MIIKTNRTKPRVQILRGWDLVSTSTLHQVHPVKAGEAIKSGMVISREWVAANNRYEWVKGCTNTKGAFIAFQDATEADVVAAEGLTGISISGDYEIQTGYFTAPTFGGGGNSFVYKVDTLLTFDGTTGNVKPASEGDYVIGRVTRIHGPKTLNPASLSRTQMFFENSETLAGSTTIAGQAGDASPLQALGNSSVITFETANMGFLQAVDATAAPAP